MVLCVVKHFMDAGRIKHRCKKATHQKRSTYNVRSDNECTLPVAGPSGQQSHFHNCCRLHCSAPRWSPVRNKTQFNLSIQYFPAPMLGMLLWGSTVSYGAASLTISPLCHIILNCAQKASSTTQCQVGWWELSLCQSQPEAGDTRSLRLWCDYSQ